VLEQKYSSFSGNPARPKLKDRGRTQGVAQTSFILSQQDSPRRLLVSISERSRVFPIPQKEDTRHIRMSRFSFSDRLSFIACYLPKLFLQV
jgi:hypothetical protein